MGVRDDGVTIVSLEVPLRALPPQSVLVGLISTLILEASIYRRSVRFVNTSTARISLSFGVPAVLDSGMTLYPQGSFNMDEFDLTHMQINGIASAVDSNISIQDYI